MRVISLVKQHYMILQRSLLFTAVTRGSRSSGSCGAIAALPLQPTSAINASRTPQA